MKHPTYKTRFIMVFFCSLLFFFHTFLSPGMAWQERDEEPVDSALHSTRFLESILRSAPAGIGMVKHRVITAANDYILDLTGYSRDELMGQSALMLYPSQEEFDFVGREKYRQISQKGTGSVETRWLRKDGEIRHIILSSTPLDPENLDDGVTFTVLDITERKKAEASLLSRTRWFLFGLSSFIFLLTLLTAWLILSLRRQKQAQQARQAGEVSLKRQNEILNALLTNLSSGVFMVEAPSGRPLIANPMAEKLLGVGVLPEASRHNLSEVYKAHRPGSTEPYPVEEMPIIKAMKGESSSVDDMIVERPDGSKVWLEIFGVPIRNEKGEVWAGLVHFQDITERKEAESEREKLQNQLFQAQKMESVGVLAGGIAHDFNNLIQVMRGNLELLTMETNFDVRTMKRLHVVVAAMDRAAKLVQQLLLFSRKVESSRMKVNLNQAIREVSRLLERTIPRMISMELHLASDLGSVSADPVQMEQALLNLANNAADAMPEGGRLIFETENVLLDESFAKAHPGAGTGSHVLLSVSDTGFGMDTATLTQVFDPFFTTKETGKGTGLGLPSVYGIVKAHGGHIQCYSEPDHGTTFRIYLPVMEQERVQERETPEEICPENGSETILFVEDEKPLRKMGQEALETFGYTVLPAASGEEALEIYKVKGQEIDLVLLDLNMPGMGGHRCLRELLKKNPLVKVLISSGYSANGQAMEVMTSGAKGFIAKPWQLKDLKLKIREVLS